MTTDHPPKFHAGDEAVCTVDLSQWAYDGQQPPKQGELVTISNVHAIEGIWGVACLGYPQTELYDEDGFAPVLPAQALAELLEALKPVAAE